MKNSMLIKLLTIVFIPLLITSVASVFIVKEISERALEAHFLEITRSRNTLIGRILSEYPETILRNRMMMRRYFIPEDDFQIFVYDNSGNLLYGDINSPEYRILSDEFEKLLKINSRKVVKVKGLYVDVIPLISPNNTIRKILIVFKYKNLKEFESVILKDLPLILTLLIILSVFIAIFMSYIFFSKFKNNLKNLIKFTKEIGNGNYETSSPEEVFTSELSELSKALKILQTKLREQERVRKKVSSEVSHELRTPISVIRSQLEAIQDGILPADKDRIEGLIRQIDKLSDLVSKVRNLTEIIATELKFEHVNLKEILKEVCSGMKSLFAEKGIDLLCNIDRDIWINGSSEKLFMAFRNILDNSLKYTENGVVEVKTSEKGDEVIVTFKDTGIGIPQEDLPYVTERFYRANTNVEGSGLGLALVKEIVELHGGKMEIKSELGKGTIVTLFFKKLGSDSIV